MQESTIVTMRLALLGISASAMAMAVVVFCSKRLMQVSMFRFLTYLMLAYAMLLLTQMFKFAP